MRVREDLTHSALEDGWRAETEKLNNWKIGTRITAGFALVISIEEIARKTDLLAFPTSNSASLANMHRAVKAAGPSIDLGSSAGDADARDHDFLAYRG